MNDHPPIDSLARFAKGLLPPREMATMAIHIARCEACRTAATRPSLQPEGRPSSYGEAIHRVASKAGHWAAQHERNKKRAPGALDQILALPTEEWNRAIRSSPRYHSYAFAQHALKACKATWSDNPHRSERLAQLALEVANRLPNKEHGRRNLNDLRAKAWAYTANCRRIQTHYARIPDALEAATEYLRHGMANDQRRAELLGFTISYLTKIRRTSDAVDLCSHVDDISTESRDALLKGKNLISLTRLHGLERRYHEALSTVHEAERLLKGNRNLMLAFSCQQNLAVYQTLSGDPLNGLITLKSAEQTYPGLPQLSLARLKWTEAVIRSKLGDMSLAAELLTACRLEFDRLGIPCDLAEVDLRIAQVRLELGQLELAVASSMKAFSILSLNGLEQNTLTALDLFRKAGGLDEG